MDEKFIVKTKKFNTWIRSELRFLPEGISIVNELLRTPNRTALLLNSFNAFI